MRAMCRCARFNAPTSARVRACTDTRIASYSPVKWRMPPAALGPVSSRRISSAERLWSLSVSASCVRARAGAHVRGGRRGEGGGLPTCRSRSETVGAQSESRWRAPSQAPTPAYSLSSSSCAHARAYVDSLLDRVGADGATLGLGSEAASERHGGGAGDAGEARGGGGRLEQGPKVAEHGGVPNDPREWCGD